MRTTISPVIKTRRCWVCKKTRLSNMFWWNDTKCKDCSRVACASRSRRKQQSEYFRRFWRNYITLVVASRAFLWRNYVLLSCIAIIQEQRRMTATRRRWDQKGSEYRWASGLRGQRGKGADHHARHQLDLQEFLCWICGRPDGQRRLHLDHHHGTGQLRGMLCNGCNTGLGLFSESRDRLQRAVEYLDKWD